MSTATTQEPRTVAKKPDTTIRLSLDAANLLRRVAVLRGESITEYVDNVLVEYIRRDLAAEAEKITREAKPPKR